MSAFTCANPQCGTDGRTRLGQTSRQGDGVILIVSPRLRVESDGQEFFIVCPQCGTVGRWRGDVAQRLERTAA